MAEVENGVTLSRDGFAGEGKGSYILLIGLPGGQTIAIGSRKALYFPRGYYAYVGSAISGFKSRLNRHLRDDKKLHWHIDYLLQKASINSIILCRTTDRVECTVAQALSRQFDSVPGFGSSDCKCRSHLFLAAGEMESTILATLNRLGVKPELLKITGPLLREVGNGVIR